MAKRSILYSQCRAAVRVVDGTAAPGDIAESHLCVAYINGFTDGFVMSGNRVVCASDASRGTIARVYVNYMEAHPKEMDAEMPVGLTNALLENYACPVPGQKKR